MTQDPDQRDKEQKEEWEAVVNALLTHADNSLARIHEDHKDLGPLPETEGELCALLRCGRTLATFMENSGRHLLDCYSERGKGGCSDGTAKTIRGLL